MPPPPRVIAFIVASPVNLLNLVGLTSVFSHPKIDGKPAYLTKVLSAGSEQGVRGADGFATIDSTPFFEYTEPIDTLIAIGGEDTLDFSPDVIGWMRRNAPRFRRIASVGSGTFMLAPTKLLDGRRVTTHWRFFDKLAKRYPHLLIEKSPIFVQDGNIYSTAGVSAAIDMALTLVEEDLGHAAANSIARDFILYMRRFGNEAQHSTLLAQQSKVNGTRMRDLPAWAKTRLVQRLDVDTLAKAVAMTPRTFARQFELRFQTTPARWVQSLRVEAACAHLQSRELPMKSIARLTGFRDEQALRRAFLQQLAITPREYQERFGISNFKDCQDSMAVAASDSQESSDATVRSSL